MQKPSRLLVFARAPQPGRCKTRLIPRLGARGAAHLHRRLVWNTLQLARASGVHTELWCAPDVRHGFFARCRRELGVTLRRQESGDLGRRMARALQDALRCGGKAVLIGTDSLDLSVDDVRQALDTLDRVDVVLQPAADGGYVLIGARVFEPRALRAVDWSSGRELAQTRTRLQRAALSWAELRVRADIDTPADYQRARRAGWL